MAGQIIYFLRHGETDWNAEGRIQGHADVPLNDRGRAQAARNGQALRALRLDLRALDFVASPLMRARETMEIVRRELDVDPHSYRTDDILKEVHYGTFQERTWQEINVTDAALVERRNADPYNWVPPGPGGESYAMLEERISRWHDGLTQDTVCVAHGGIMRVLHRAVGGLTEREAVTLRAPQDKVLVIESGRLSWL
ncbi:MAG: histidine phosphatase family protein [Hyphomicrobiaceae bacterium]|nr:MAG: histidine phosphatase family protein [Hyphomicrobiaceae bacterium]